ncbi:TetR/AcrR family transcriptional regulator C-terminal domain-containing protein [Streptacidiphilus sp. MAP5-52]|uniref:TetR/AcrR family transcriptional regulator C-terminal domain-containing protein n=1 Tax=Streptacidiphilus sp. MAP5-52 TaxID=3156267 RepID=UPI003517A882
MSRQRNDTELSLSVIAETALRIVDQEGPDGLSFRSLAAALGVSHMAVHRKVGSLDGLLDVCVDHLAYKLPAIAHDAPWAEGTERRFRGLYEVMAAHPGIVALRRGRPWVSEQILNFLVEPALAANRRAGMTPREAVDCYRRLYLFTLGAAAFVDHLNPREAQRRTRIALAGLEPTLFPELTGSVSDIVESVVDHEVYYTGLRQLIEATGRLLGDRIPAEPRGDD